MKYIYFVSFTAATATGQQVGGGTVTLNENIIEFGIDTLSYYIQEKNGFEKPPVFLSITPLREVEE